MKSFIAAIFVLACGSSMACQYEMDLSKQVEEVFHKAYPNATSVTEHGLEYTTFSLLPIKPNDCPSHFKVSGDLTFINDGKACRGTIVLKYRDDTFSSGNIRGITCRAINSNIFDNKN